MAKRKSRAGQVMAFFMEANRDEAITLYDIATEIMRHREFIGRKPKAAKAMGQKVGTVLERSA